MGNLILKQSISSDGSTCNIAQTNITPNILRDNFNSTENTETSFKNIEGRFNNEDWALVAAQLGNNRCDYFTNGKDSEKNGLQYFNTTTAESINTDPEPYVSDPSSGYHTIRQRYHNNDNAYMAEIAIGFYQNKISYRRYENGTYGDWLRIIDSGIIADQEVLTSKYPHGFTSKLEDYTWGKQLGTAITGWGSNNGKIQFREYEDKLNLSIDGYFYQNNGMKRVLDEDDKTEILKSIGSTSTGSSALQLLFDEHVKSNNEFEKSVETTNTDIYSKIEQINARLDSDSYLSTSGGCMQDGAIIELAPNMIIDSPNAGAMHAHNSNITGVHSLFINNSDNNSGISFERFDGNVDSIFATDGHLYFSPNRMLGDMGDRYEVIHYGNLPIAAENTLGTVKLNGGKTSEMKYGLKVDSNNKAYVEVPFRTGLVSTNGPLQTANSQATNNLVYLNLTNTDSNTVKNSIAIKGAGATSVSTDEAGNITINSTDTNTVYTHPDIEKTESTGDTKLSLGSKFTVIESVNTNSQGHVVAISTKTLTLPTQEETSGYTHPTTAGYKHIPAGGKDGQILRWSADGTAEWDYDYTIVYSAANDNDLGLIRTGYTQNGKNYPVVLDDDGRAYVNVPWSGSSGSATNTDTKNTAGSTNTTSKIFLIGSTLQSSNPQTYSNANCYASGGYLYSNNTKVSVEGHSHAWSTITGKPSSFTPATHSHSEYALVSHTHNYAGSSSAGGAANSANWLNTDKTLTFGASGLQYFNNSTSTTSGANNNANPTNDWYHIIRMNHANSNGYYAEIAMGFHQNSMYYRRVAAGGEHGWFRVLDSDNYSNYCATKDHTHTGYASSNHTHSQYLTASTISSESDNNIISYPDAASGYFKVLKLSYYRAGNLLAYKLKLWTSSALTLGKTYKVDLSKALRNDVKPPTGYNGTWAVSSAISYAGIEGNLSTNINATIIPNTMVMSINCSTSLPSSTEMEFTMLFFPFSYS